VTTETFNVNLDSVLTLVDRKIAALMQERMR